MMQYSNLLLIGLASLGSTVTTVTAIEALPKRSFTTTHGACTAVCKDNLFNDCEVHCSTTATLPADRHERPSVTMTLAAGGVTATVACKPGVNELSDCTVITNTPTPTVVVVGKTQKAIHHLAKRSPEPAIQAAVHKHSSVPLTIVANGMTIALLCKDGEDDFDDCRDIDPRPTPKPVLEERGIVTVTNDGCTAVCSNSKPSPACDLQCDEGFVARVALPTPKPTEKPVLGPRGLSVVHGGCTTVCWDQYPGTGCDILCHDTSITKMPSPTPSVSSMWTTAFTTLGCTISCQDLFPGTECGVQCPGSLSSQSSGNMIDFPSQVAPATFLGFSSTQVAHSASSIGVRKDIQVRQAREARLDRKFGMDGHNDQQDAVWEALSKASVVIAEAVTMTATEVVIPSAASVAMSQALSFLSSVTQSVTPTTVSATLTGTAPVTVTSGGTASILFPASTGNGSVVSQTLKSSMNFFSSLLATPTPTPVSTSISIIVTNGPDTTTSTAVFTGGASYEGHGLTGLLLVILAGVIGSVAFMI